MTVSYTKRQYGPGEVLFRQDDAADGFFYLLEGRIEISVLAGDSQTTVGYVENGDFFGEMTIIEKVGRNATAVSAAPLEVLFFDKEGLEHEIAHSEILTTLYRHTCAKLLRQNQATVEKSYVDLDASLLQSGAFHSMLSLEAINAHSERFLGNARLTVSAFPFTVGRGAPTGEAVAITDTDLKLNARGLRMLAAPHFEFIRHHHQFIVRDQSRDPGTRVNGQLLRLGREQHSAALRTGYNEIILRDGDPQFGFLLYVQ